MFDDLRYCIRMEHVNFKILHGALIIFKGFNICGLHILDDFTIIGNVLLSSQDFYNKNRL